MKASYKIYDTEDKDLFIEVSSHYFKVNDAKEVYRKSLKDEKVDDSLMFEIALGKSNELIATFTFSVGEGEQFALTLLNLCNSIKR